MFMINSLLYFILFSLVLHSTLSFIPLPVSSSLLHRPTNITTTLVSFPFHLIVFDCNSPPSPATRYYNHLLSYPTPLVTSQHLCDIPFLVYNPPPTTLYLQATWFLQPPPTIKYYKYYKPAFS